MNSPLFSSSAPTGWNQLSASQKQMFYDISSKSDGEMTAHEWFEHLVPAKLRDDPAQVEVWMNGGTVTTADGETIEMPDRDVSRKISGENGGEYTAENTRMEDSSTNRSRQDNDMTVQEEAEMDLTDARDIDIIDTYVGDESSPELIMHSDGTYRSVWNNTQDVPDVPVIHESPMVQPEITLEELVVDHTAEVVAGTSVATETAIATGEVSGGALDVITDNALPLLGGSLIGVSVGKKIYDSLDIESDEDKLVISTLGALGTTLLACAFPVIVPIAVAGNLAYRVAPHVKKALS